MESILEKSFADFKAEYDNKFIAESKSKMKEIAQYYRAMTEQSRFPERKCNAPWVSAVIESDGNVLPCFFHKPYGNINNGSFMEIVNSKKAIDFRKKLNVKEDTTCKKCVCSLHVGITQQV